MVFWHYRALLFILFFDDRVLGYDGLKMDALYEASFLILMHHVMVIPFALLLSQVYRELGMNIGRLYL